MLEGKRVVLIDDTIVRGTTSRPIVNLLRQAGAKEVHMRVHAPPMMWPCYLGVDLARREELIAARMSVEEIGQHIGADTIGYLSLEGLLKRSIACRRLLHWLSDRALSGAGSARNGYGQVGARTRGCAGLTRPRRNGEDLLTELRTT